MSYNLPVTGGTAILRVFCRFPIVLLVVLVGFGGYLAWPEAILPGCTPGMVSITFDDGYESTYTEAFPILKKYGYSATVYVITDLVGKPGYMTREQLRELADAGWEIGSHTTSHPHLTELTPCEVELELATSKAWLAGAGFKVESFATPYGEYNDEVLELVDKYYVFHRTSWPRGINPIPLGEGGRLTLKSVWTDSTTTVEEVEEWINQAREERGWLLLAFHRIGESGEYNWEPGQLEEVMSYLAGSGFQPFGNDDLDALMERSPE